MSISNTNILIRRSTTSGVPVSLQAGELAYSYLSNTMFIGTPGGTGVVNVGGQYYTSQIDDATSSNTANKLVRRDSIGTFSGRLDGIAGKADVITNARDFSISGGDITAATQSFDGSAAIILNATLNNVPSLGAGTYGSQTQVPVIQVAANGRVMNVTTSTISTTLSTAADSGSGSVNLLNDTLRFNGLEGITTFNSGNTVSFEVDTSVVRSNAFTGGTQTINTNLTIGANNNLTVTGNLIVFGNVSTQNVQTFAVADPLIQLGIGNYFSDVLDIGFASHYNDGQNAHTGLVRDAAVDKEWYFFEGYLPEISSNNNINIYDPSFRTANVHANYYKGNLIAVNANTFALGVSGNTHLSNLLTVDGPVLFNNTTNLVGNANTTNNLGVGGTFYVSGVSELGSSLKVNGNTILVGQANTVNNLGIGQDFYVTGKSVLTGQANTINDIGVGGNAYLAGNLSVSGAVTLTNRLTVPNGGTGVTSFNVGEVVIGNGPDALQQLANVASINTTLPLNHTVTNLQTDVYGRVLNFTSNAISGLTVTQGGTGVNSFTANGIIYGNGTGNLLATAAPGVLDQSWSNQILTVTNAGVPTWSTAMDGGQF